MLKNANIIACALANTGCTKIFQVPGDYELPLNEAFEIEERIEPITCPDELTTGYTAYSYARASGEVGVSFTLYSVGQSQTIVMADECDVNVVPMLFIFAWTSPESKFDGRYKYNHHIDWYRAMAATEQLMPIFHYKRVNDLYDAFNLAVVTRRAVALYITVETMNEKPEIPIPRYVRESPKSKVNKKAVENFMRGIHRQGDKYLLLGDKIMDAPGAGEIVEEIIRALPGTFRKILFTSTAKTVIDENKFPMEMLTNTVTFPKSVTTMLCLGVLWTNFNTYWNLVKLPAHMKRVYVDVEDSTKVNSPGWERWVPTLNQILSDVNAAAIKPSSEVEEIVRAKPVTGKFCRTVTAGIDVFQEYLTEIDNYNNITVSLDVGTFQFPFQFRVLIGRNKMIMSNLGNMLGTGMSYAVGAQLARPDDRVYLLIGDGSFQLAGINPLALALKLRLPLVIILFDNGRYTVESELLTQLHAPEEDRFDDLNNFDYKKLVESLTNFCDFKAVYSDVKTRDQMREALSHAHNKPKQLHFIRLVLDVGATSQGALDFTHANTGKPGIAPKKPMSVKKYKQIIEKSHTCETKFTKS